LKPKRSNAIAEKQVIQLCPMRFKVFCPKSWDSLEPLAYPRTKHCQTCNQTVYLCVSDEETLQHAEQGHCVARTIPRVDSATDDSENYVLGEPDAKWLRKKVAKERAKREVEERATREINIGEALRDGHFTARRCQACHYPVAKWYDACRICGGSTFYEGVKW
jgi:hypothetical protein